MSTLYQLTSEYMELLTLAEDPDTDPQAFADTLEGIEGAIEDKADGYAMVIRQIMADVTGLKAEIDRLTARKRAGENAIERMKEALQYSMQATGKTKFKTQLFSFGIQKNPEAAVVDETDLSKIPERFLVRKEPTVNRKALKDAIKAGDEEAAKIAHLEQGESLRIR